MRSHVPLPPFQNWVVTLKNMMIFGLPNIELATKLRQLFEVNARILNRRYTFQGLQLISPWARLGCLFDRKCRGGVVVVRNLDGQYALQALRMLRSLEVVFCGQESTAMLRLRRRDPPAASDSMSKDRPQRNQCLELRAWPARAFLVTYRSR